MRWTVFLLGGALIAAALVGYALVRITSPNGDVQTSPTASDSTASSAPTLLASDSTASSAPTVLPSETTTSGSEQAPTTTASSTPTSQTPPSESAPPSATAPSGPSPTTSQLPGSGVTLPASWSGTAKVSITVLGECATGRPSVYTDVTGDLALGLMQNKASAAQISLPEGLSGNEPTLTLGINGSGVPALALYTAQIDDNGVLQSYWNLEVTTDTDDVESVTHIEGALVNTATDGTNPNIMVDSETSLQPCESAGTVALPRALANGSTLTGTVTADHAELTLQATTIDGKREVTVHITAERRQ